MDLQSDHLERLIKRFQQQRPLRTGSLIITLFGDAIVPRGGTVWLGSLIELLAPMGVSQRLVRTSVFRLTREGWLMAEKVGRRSYYGLTGAGRRRQALGHAMRRALEMAGAEPAAVGHVHAFGTSTTVGDREEAGAIGDVLGSHAAAVPVVAAKSAPTTTTEMPTPPGIGPNSWPMVTKRSSAIFERSSMIPMKMNKGMAIRVSRSASQ